ncbi:hypothetical protein C8N32_13610 [Rhodovulum imhoffii]|uniref:Uncharacterized protein n=1 Tax=Rhodovulum imhoffii TaxID=365340 RepID=A0A2T5BL51_9RHOB|nr:hypothetical protein [Rhodovulum imhoffii]MBK5932506.1 hypothetical protein [Rhodovulum imhoffii]PTM99707.1 hypothetical protein C8N32_13610 [Rhodovulum imhoffii]
MASHRTAPAERTGYVSETDSGRQPAGRTRLVAVKELLIFDYSGFELPEFHPRHIEEYGDSPDCAFFADEEEALQNSVPFSGA